VQSGCRALVRLRADEAIGLPLDVLVPDEFRADHQTGVARYAHTREGRLVGAGPVEVSAIDKAGSRIEIALTLTDVTVLSGSPCVLAVIRDVTAQRRAEQDLKRANDRLRSFVTTASHELRTPLAAVIGFANALRAASLDPAKDRMAEAIERNATHAARLADDLLTLSRPQAGVIGRSVEPVNLATAVSQAIEQADVEAQTEIADDAIVLVDPTHPTRILVNYLTNAKRYGTPPIRVRVSQSSGHAAVTVIDAGPGVEPAIIEQLFTSFTQAAPAGGSGCGLGLSIVRGLAEANGGRVFYEWNEGEARFNLELPTPR
jgi:PAS domain S-box-containing protein